MAEWREVSFGDLGTIYDGPHATPVRRETGPYFLNISSLKDGRLDLAESDHVAEEDFDRWTRRVVPQGGDLLFSYETRLGDAALMPEGVRACLGRRMALMRPNREVVDPRFLLYCYLSPAFKRLIEQNTVHGATVNRIALSTMGAWSLQIPALPNQRAIAEVLGALDDKIASNTRLATTADALARALLALAEPNVSVSEIATQSRLTVNPEGMTALRVAHFSLPAFDVGTGPEIVDPKTIKSNKFMVSEPAVLVSKLNPRFPRVWNLPRLPDEPALASTEFVVLVPTACSTTVLWALTSQPRFGAALEGMVAGTSGSHQRVKPAEMLATLVPDPRRLEPSWLAQVDALGARSLAAQAENVTLAATRDTLLPQLMSGKLSMREAAEMAGL